MKSACSLDPRFVCGVAAAALLCGAPVHAQSRTAAVTDDASVDPGHIEGVWISSRFNPDRDEERVQTNKDAARRPAARTGPPLADWAKAIMAKRIADEKAGRPVPNSKALCLPAGTPQSMFPPAALPIQILVTKDQITILFEEFSYFRIIRMNQPHNPDPDPTYFGDSVGHWEGDTLVVDTTGISTKTTIGNDTNGAPHTEDLHVVERIRRIGDTIEDQVSMEDPKTFPGVWTERNVLKSEPGLQLHEYYCENDRNTPDASGHTGVTLPTTASR